MNQTEYRQAVADAWAELRARPEDPDPPPFVPRPSPDMFARRALAARVLETSLPSIPMVRLLGQLQADGFKPSTVAQALAEASKVLALAGDVL